jgi:hypothetical protein
MRNPAFQDFYSRASITGFCMIANLLPTEKNMRLNLALALFFTFPFLGLPQGIEPQMQALDTQVKNLLSSPKSIDRAWAAHFIGKYRLEKSIPPLTALLADAAKSQDKNNEFFIQSALDALIQLNASLPDEAIVSLFDQKPFEDVILLGQSRERHGKIFFELVDKKMPGLAFVALCNMLGENKTPGFSALLLKNLTINASIVVYYDRIGSSLSGGPPGAIPKKMGIVVPKDYPPIGYYSFNMMHGSVLLASGVNDIFYNRQLAEPGVPVHLEVHEKAFCLKDSSTCINCLYQSLKKNKRDLEVFYYKPLLWKDSATYKKEVFTLIEKINESHMELVKELLAANLLTPMEANISKPNIVLSLMDERSDQSIPLPEINGKDLRNTSFQAQSQ